MTMDGGPSPQRPAAIRQRGPMGRGGREGPWTGENKRWASSSVGEENEEERRESVGGREGQECERMSAARSIHNGRQGVTERRRSSSKVRARLGLRSTDAWRER